MIPATEALQRLQDGNRRFASGESNPDAATTTEKRRQLVSGQQPFAVILGCSDSRVPAEILFDQGLGDLFVIRIAGNIAAPSQIGSVEFAVENLGSRLVIVLGHSGCGAVSATLDLIASMSEPDPSNLNSILHRIRPGIENLVVRNRDMDREALLSEAVRTNVRATSDALRHGSPVIEKNVAEKGVLIVGAEYDLNSGKVDFFDGVPQVS